MRTQRYSVPGYPSLYLAEHVFGCWEEFSRPSLNSCLISRFKLDGEISVLDLRIPDAREWESTDYSKREMEIITFPLIIASTFKSPVPNAVFKAEYIIPQVLLQYVKQCGYEKNRGIDKSKRHVYGIRYTSVNKQNKADGNIAIWKSDRDMYGNIVIPVTDIKDEYCSRLCNLFQFTEPICEEFESVSYSRKDEAVDSNDNYKDTRLGHIEATLRDRRLYKIDTFGNGTETIQ